MDTTEKTTGSESVQDRGKTEITSIASLSADLAWSLLTPEEQRLVLEYIDKVRERYIEKTHTEQEETPIVVK